MRLRPDIGGQPRNIVSGHRPVGKPAMSATPVMLPTARSSSGCRTGEVLADTRPGWTLS
jgi:hypothetical protein